MNATARLTYPLQTGDLTVQVDRAEGNFSASSLYRVAERYNPKRGFLFVSTVLGKHYPSRADHMTQVFESLAAQLPKDINKFSVIGMAETAIGLGAGIYQQAVKRFGEGLYGSSTRFPTSGLASNFSEPHSHATEQCLCLPVNSDHLDLLSQTQDLILVDDELTTGRTISNLTKTVLSQTGIKPNRIFIVSITDWSRGRLNLKLPEDIEVHFISLIKGSYSWAANGNRFDLPAFTDSPTPPSSRMASFDSPRDWVGSPESFNRWPASVDRFTQAIRPGEKVLVIGTGEFMAKPLAVAQTIETRGGVAFFSSTTRSPAMTGNTAGYFEDYGVSSRILFSDIYQGNGMNYLYNHDIEEWDRVLLYTDAHHDQIPQSLLRGLKAKKGIVVSSDFELANVTTEH